VEGLEHVLTRLAWKTKRDDVHQIVPLRIKVIDVAAVVIVELRFSPLLLGHLPCHLIEANSEFLLTEECCLSVLCTEDQEGGFDLMEGLRLLDGPGCWPHCSGNTNEGVSNGIQANGRNFLGQIHAPRKSRKLLPRDQNHSFSTPHITFPQCTT
jgi:hypothetical protein